MSIHVALRHVTHYKYDRPVSLGPQTVRLRPAPHCRTRILSYSLEVLPAGHFVNWQQDPLGNHLARLVFPDKVQELRVAVDLVAEMSVLNPFDFFLAPHAMACPFQYSAVEEAELAPCRAVPPATPLLAAYVAGIDRTPRPTVDFIVGLNQRLSEDIRYLIRPEPGVQTPEQTLQLRSGSCRDSAWLLVHLLRHLGLAARFASGYLIQLAADVKALDGPSGAEHDFTDLHAWCEVYLPGAGWIGLDPTSGLLAGEGHIPLACSPEPGSAAPVTGSVDECEAQFSHEMRIERIWEAPRVTKPYTEAQWSAIVAAGRAVDEVLSQADVRLTMGGEPTFVAADDPQGAEWNTEALGPTKHARALQLFRRLQAHYAPQGLLHFGQGKWYPGEQLPRWSLNCFWRRDGLPLWQDPQRCAADGVADAATPAAAAALLRAVAAELALDPDQVFAGYEDTWYYLWRERRLPTNVDPFDSRLDDPLERERLRRVFERGLETAVGHVLPIARNATDTGWTSGPWFLRAERCYLLPGDSAMGYRLPLDSQPWVAREDYPYVHQPDPASRFPPLPHPAVWREQSARQAAPAAIGPDHAPGPGESAATLTRTALCAEPRDGVLHVFMPPLQQLEAYLELVAAIERAATRLDLRVRLEGYEPPRDPRLLYFRVTPDPGVIEVNIHPAAHWDELVERTTHLYESAHQCRLASEKFMLDGRHTGTGGGNHVVLGGATPADSPFLRRPDLLQSLLGYWHNHPSLSYLFSGLFIGPTSQSPRIDEARDDALYELEIAFSQLQAVQPGAPVPPWFVDRVLRNLLVDVTGNTHRAEFCIDKLFSPDGSTGRLGLLELRAFEMPPHPQMSLVQQLLLRSLLARFWEQPYRPTRLARWGTALHDRFMLPWFVQQDFADVLAEQRAAGFALDEAWFAPQFEFRFPRHGDYHWAGLHLELRHALEPWHVMGEEGMAGGTVRYVDSSVERVQVKVDGLAPDRYRVTCNGQSVPLRSTGRSGEYIAGVRYRAWQPPNALHPGIAVHAPLTFDIIDTWMQRNVGGCRYHVAHPGGRNYETFPVNAFEAESRRLARFFREGHSHAVPSLREAPADPDFPFTLDLRKPR